MPFVCLVSYLMWSQGVPSQFHFMAGSRYQTQRKLIAVLRQEKLLARLSWSLEKVARPRSKSLNML